MKTLTRLIATSVIAASVAIQPVSGWSLEPIAATAAQATSEIKVIVDGKAVSFKPAPVQQNGTTFVPMRPIFEALQATVSWEQQTQTIFATKGGTAISLKIGAKQATINGKAQQLDTPPQLIQGATMVPLRFIGEALGAEVAWESATRTIRIRSVEQISRDEYDALPDFDTYETFSFSDIVYMYDDSIVTIETDRGQGSGMVVGDRHVLTNYHVMTGATKGTVELTNGKSLKINGLLAYDEDADLAVIETASSLGVRPVILDTEQLFYKGDPVLAIGSPQGFRNTVSEGIISNVHYEGGVSYIQTTAAIDSGSSGGALFDEYGTVVGIVTATIPDTTAHLNLAVSSEHALPLLEQAKRSGTRAAFLPSRLPASLTNASNAEILKLMKDEFSVLWTPVGVTELTGWQVNRDSKGWLVIEANIDPGFYTVFADKIAQDMRYWAVDAGSELQRMLPNQPVELIVHYEQTFGYEPRGFKAEEVTSLGNNKWKVRYPVIHFQTQDRGHIKIGRH
ncbi:stalk domain-containing protein [Paenibacillus daejeonensis]|uniref:stalk domain-containing protein n=1 Tax=Paenibacillus daejeonensis TaxID=135193 RepID=UPI000379A36A|nr:stalk domain-containing protein [Paenibacillus daejeonensis]